MFAIVDVRWP